MKYPLFYDSPIKKLWKIWFFIHLLSIIAIGKNTRTRDQSVDGVAHCSHQDPDYYQGENGLESDDGDNGDEGDDGDDAD